MDARKLLHTVLILIIAGTALSGVADTTSQTYAQESLNRALLTYTAARTLNGVVSVAQGTEVALEPGGVGVVLAPGQVLDPINDLIERFSSVMLVAASSLGLQIVLIKITSAWGVTALLITVLAASLVFSWAPRFKDSDYASATFNVALLLVFVRFAIPIVVIFTNFMFSEFLLSDHDRAAAALQGATTEIEQIRNREEAQETDDRRAIPDETGVTERSGNYVEDLLESAKSGLEESVSRLGDSTKEAATSLADWFDTVSVGDRLAQLKQSASEASSRIIDLIVIFVLQTILFPIGFLWLFAETLKAVASRTISSIGTQNRS